MNNDEKEPFNMLCPICNKLYLDCSYVFSCTDCVFNIECEYREIGRCEHTKIDMIKMLLVKVENIRVERNTALRELDRERRLMKRTVTGKYKNRQEALETIKERLKDA